MDVTSYNDGQVPSGGIVIALFSKAGVSKGNYILEEIDPQRDTKVVERPDINGGPNGWKATETQDNSSAVIQIGTVTTYIVKRGDYFTYTHDTDVGPEKWVISKCNGPAFKIGDYYKQNLSLKKAYF